MRLIRFGQPGMEKPGIVLQDNWLDVSQFGEDYTEQFWATDGPKRLAEWLAGNPELSEIDKSTRLACPLTRPSKIICIGLNYADHALESQMQAPAEPVVFFKATTAMAGPYDDVILPRGSEKTDWEVELAVIIGKEARYVSEEDALSHVAGYCLHNDYSERAFQLERGGQWVKGKSCDTFAPLGPWIATPDEFDDVQNLQLWLSVNGKTMQDGNTSNMIFGVAFLVHYLSQFMTLLPGDIISTGTPAGVGLGQKPEPWYLKAGDIVELGGDGLGCSRQRIIPFQQ
jgi:2,4-diketo-3-deoxy-L-fuconate hydrolase